MSHAPRPVHERFWEKVDRSAGPSGCWPFLGCRSPLGYGRFNLGNRSVPASRVALILTSGDPGKLYVLHSCDNPPCCNPAHLRAATQRDNIHDAQIRGRAPIRTYKGRARPQVVQCPHGHWMLGNNLYIHKDGRRSCVTCRRASVRAWRAKAVA